MNNCARDECVIYILKQNRSHPSALNARQVFVQAAQSQLQLGS